MNHTRITERGDTIWCEQCGENPAIYFDDIAVLCGDCKPYFQVTIQDEYGKEEKTIQDVSVLGNRIAGIVNEPGFYRMAILYDDPREITVQVIG